MDREGLPWVELYRPHTIDNIVQQNEIVSALKLTLSSSNLPHMLFYGPPGTGKTSCALALARQLFGPSLLRERVLELNASDERGIRVVREKIKRFAQRSISMIHDKKYLYPCPAYKIIILDEADAMTDESQLALRQIIEAYSGITRFFLICNFVTRIIKQLVSRCSKYRFKQINMESIGIILDKICHKENIVKHPELYDTLHKVSNGDLRRAITILQHAKYIDGENIKISTIIHISGFVPTHIIKNIIHKLKKISSYDDLMRINKAMLSFNYSISKVLIALFNYIANDDNLDDIKKSLITIKLNDSYSNINNGADDNIQMLYILSFIRRIYQDLEL